MATMAMLGVGLTAATPLAPVYAQDQDADVDIERDNSIRQSIEQEQEACTNEAEVEVDDDDFVDIAGENEAEVEQENNCIVAQGQTATNTAAIVDFSTNDFDIEQFLASLDLDLDE